MVNEVPMPGENEMVNMMSFDSGKIKDIRSLARILVRQSYSECCVMLVHGYRDITFTYFESIGIRYSGWIDWSGHT